MREIGIIMNGVTGRMGHNRHLKRSILAIMEDALALFRAAEQRGAKHEVAQDKLWLPGLRKIRMLIDTGFFGRVLSARGELGYKAARDRSWVDVLPVQQKGAS